MSHIIMLLLLMLPVGEGKIFKVKKSKKAATQKRGSLKLNKWKREREKQKGMTNKNFHAGVAKHG